MAFSSSMDPNSSGAIGSSRVGRNAAHGGRRLTRARGTAGTVTSATQQLQSSSQSTPNRRNFASSRIVRKWKRVRRAPPGTTFSVDLWVPIDQLTEEERALHLPPELNELTEPSDAEIVGEQKNSAPTTDNENIHAIEAEPLDIMMIDVSSSDPPPTEGGIASSITAPMKSTEPTVTENEATALPVAPIETEPTHSSVAQEKKIENFSSEAREKEEPNHEPPLESTAPIIFNEVAGAPLNVPVDHFTSNDGLMSEIPPIHPTGEPSQDDTV